MSREIKFRAWNGEQMILPDYIDRRGIAWWKENSIPSSAANENVMQFTGLHDKNGKEIYEGDIIKYIQHHFNTDLKKNKVKMVKWNTDRWNVFETNAGESAIEIIGNIYENPELLTNLK